MSSYEIETVKKQARWKGSIIGGLLRCRVRQAYRPEGVTMQAALLNSRVAFFQRHARVIATKRRHASPEHAESPAKSVGGKRRFVNSIQHGARACLTNHRATLGAASSGSITRKSVRAEGSIGCPSAGNWSPSRFVRQALAGSEDCIPMWIGLEAVGPCYDTVFTGLSLTKSAGDPSLGMKGGLDHP